MNGIGRIIREAVTKEVRDALGMYSPRPMVPPRCEIPSEQLVLCALLQGRADPKSVDLEPEDLFIPLHRFGLAALRLVGPPESSCLPGVPAWKFVAALKAVGAHGDPERLLEELSNMRIADEVLNQVGDEAVSDLQTHVLLIKEASKARKLIAWLDRITADLRSGAITADQARERLRPNAPSNGKASPRAAHDTRPDGSGRVSPHRS